MTVDEKIAEAGDTVAAATNDATDSAPKRTRPTRSEFASIRRRTRKSTPSGASKETDGGDTPLPVTSISTPSAKPTNAWNKRWRTPTNVRELAGQANEVATMVLNGQINTEVAARYGALVRGIAQMMSIEVTRARFVRTEPILTLDAPPEDLLEADDGED